MVEHMRERNAMQNGPGDPPKYTSSDSAQFAQTYARMGENAKKLKKYQKENPPKAMGGDAGFGVGRNFPEQTRNQMFKQLDSLEKNPYFPTAVERIKNKKKK